MQGTATRSRKTRCRIPEIHENHHAVGQCMNRLFESLEKFDRAIALVEENGHTVTYAELARRADETALALGRRCLVSIEAANELPPLLAYIGACRAGCPVILTDQESTAKDTRVRATFAPSFHYGKSAT